MKYLVYSQDPTNLTSFSNIFPAPFLDDNVWIIYAYDINNELLGAIAITIANDYDIKTKTISKFGSIEYVVSIKKGIGTILMLAAEQWFKDHSNEMTQKIIQVISIKSSVGFYLTLGYDYYNERDGKVLYGDLITLRKNIRIN